MISKPMNGKLSVQGHNLTLLRSELLGFQSYPSPTITFGLFPVIDYNPVQTLQCHV